MLVQPCAGRTIDLLGDRHDDPSVSDMEAILGALLGEFPVAVVRLMLAAYAAEGYPCQATFEALLDGDQRLAFDAPSTNPSGRPNPRPDDEEKREARRRRKHEKKEAERAAVERARRLSDQASLRTRGGRARVVDAPSNPGDSRPPVRERGEDSKPPTSMRRPVTLVHQYPAELRQDDRFVGSVVFAEVIFGGVVGAKWRPAVVVAASRFHVVVRPCYSEGGVRSYDWRSTQLHDWKDAGLDRPTWVSHEERLIPRRRLGHVFGQVSEADWCQL